MNMEMPSAKEEIVTDSSESLKNAENGRIKLEEFYGQPKFTKEEIDADIKRCGDARLFFDRKNHEHGDIELMEKMLDKGKRAEVVLRKGITTGWIKAKVEVVDTSEYDDYFNHIDEILDIELEDEGSDHLGLSIDFATSNSDVELKLKDIFELLDKGEMSKIKYFKTTSRGLDKDVRMPRIIIGASSGTVDRLSSLEEDIDYHTKSEKDSAEAIKKDVFKYVLFGEILAQLSVFCNRLDKVVKILERNPGIRSNEYRNAVATLDVYRKSLDKIRIIQEKSGASMDKIKTHIRGDITATHIGQSLGKLADMPVGNFKDHRKIRS